MRARSIKPGICDNELLGTADPFFSLLFERLWMMADREGRLEDRPLRIKAQAFPYRDGLDVEPMLAWLHQHQFILRYVTDGQRYIQVLKFADHQSPHVKEAPSKIPAPDKHQTSTVLAPEIPAPAALTPSSLTPDSGLLTADSSSLRSQELSAAAPPSRKRVPRESIEEEFLELKLAYPERNGDYRWKQARGAAHARLSEGHSWPEILAGVRRYAEHCRAAGKIGTEFVMQASRFLGPDKPFLLPWKPPPRPENATERILRHLNGSDDSRVIDHEPDEQALLPSF